MHSSRFCLQKYLSLHYQSLSDVCYPFPPVPHIGRRRDLGARGYVSRGILGRGCGGFLYSPSKPGGKGGERGESSSILQHICVWVARRGTQTNIPDCWTHKQISDIHIIPSPSLQSLSFTISAALFPAANSTNAVSSPAATGFPP